MKPVCSGCGSSTCDVKNRHPNQVGGLVCDECLVTISESMIESLESRITQLKENKECVEARLIKDRYKLKPCPHCEKLRIMHVRQLARGGEDSINPKNGSLFMGAVTSNEYHLRTKHKRIDSFVKCDGCGAQGPIADTHLNAARLWNEWVNTFMKNSSIKMRRRSSVCR